MTDYCENILEVTGHFEQVKFFDKLFREGNQFSLSNIFPYPKEFSNIPTIRPDTIHNNIDDLDALQQKYAECGHDSKYASIVQDCYRKYGAISATEWCVKNWDIGKDIIPEKSKRIIFGRKYYFKSEDVSPKSAIQEFSKIHPALLFTLKHKSEWHNNEELSHKMSNGKIYKVSYN